MRDNGGTQTVATDLNLAPLSNGDYLIEVTREVRREKPDRSRGHPGVDGAVRLPDPVRPPTRQAGLPISTTVGPGSADLADSPTSGGAPAGL